MFLKQFICIICFIYGFVNRVSLIVVIFIFYISSLYASMKVLYIMIRYRSEVDIQMAFYGASCVSPEKSNTSRVESTASISGELLWFF